MDWVRKFIAYYQDNPEGYWFKRRLYGWGWMPVRWQGWFIVFISSVIIAGGIFIGEVDDAPGAMLLGPAIAIAILIIFGYWKGERPRWQWGIPKEVDRDDNT